MTHLIETFIAILVHQQPNRKWIVTKLDDSFLNLVHTLETNRFIHELNQIVQFKLWTNNEKDISLTVLRRQLSILLWTAMHISDLYGKEKKKREDNNISHCLVPFFPVGFVTDEIHAESSDATNIICASTYLDTNIKPDPG